MGFTNACFMTVHDKDHALLVARKIKDLGDRKTMEVQSDVKYPCIIATSTNIISICELKELASAGFVDCGTNEELFLAIAALRNDSDIHQWFTDGNNWVSSDIHTLIEFEDYFKEIGFNYANTHKATIEELKEHFDYNLQSSQL